jgi:hypothetical protein
VIKNGSGEKIDWADSSMRGYKEREVIYFYDGDMVNFHMNTNIKSITGWIQIPQESDIAALETFMAFT